MVSSYTDEEVGRGSDATSSRQKVSKVGPELRNAAKMETSGMKDFVNLSDGLSEEQGNAGKKTKNCGQNEFCYAKIAQIVPPHDYVFVQSML